MKQHRLLSDLSTAEAEAAGEGMVASEVSQAAAASQVVTANAVLASSGTKSTAGTMFGRGIIGTIIVGDAPFHCPVCKRQILSRDSINVIPTVRRLAGTTFYCPSCELFVEPVEESATRLRA
jgi:hypothetical protein